MTKRELKIETPDGRADAGLFTVDGAASKGAVIVYMDAFGLRPALDQIAERIAGLGYAVLVPDTLYRFAPYGPYDARTAFSDEATKAEIIGMIRGTTQAMTITDTGAFLEALTEAGHNGPVATVGYCMGGGAALEAARDGQDLIAAISFHGTLDSALPAQPGAVKARLLVLHGDADPMVPREQVAAFMEEMDRAGASWHLHAYSGVRHGFTDPGSYLRDLDAVAYDASADRQSWAAMMNLLDEVLTQ